MSIEIKDFFETNSTTLDVIEMYEECSEERSKKSVPNAVLREIDEEYADERDARIAATKEEIRKLKVKAYKCKDLANKATDENVRENFMSRYEGLMEEANYLEAHMYDPDDE